ncbi:MAG: ABC transporter substrate-binding protein [Bacteroidales bacterium]|nr:ABC transporter substrate-binding protein [Bacteroidales bacterium]
MKQPFRVFSTFLLVLSFLSLILSCQTPLSQEEKVDRQDDSLPGYQFDRLQKVGLLPYWITTAQFAGYYVGIEKGIFQRYGLDLEIIPFQQTMLTNQLIRDQKADFFLLWLVNAIELKASGLDIVNIAQLSSRSSLMLLAKRSSGIKSIDDMDGKRAAIWSGYELQPRALFQQYDVDVTIVPIGSSNNLFLTDGVEIINASWFDEYHTIMNSGYNVDELETFFFFDHDLNFLEDGIYCLRSTLEQDPGLCKRFVEATLASWKYVFDHPEEAVRIVLAEQRKQNMPANVAHQTWMLDRYRDLYYPEPESGMNTVLPESVYKEVAKILLEAGLIGEIPPFREYYIPFQSLDTLNRTR